MTSVHGSVKRINESAGILRCTTALPARLPKRHRTYTVSESPQGACLPKPWIKKNHSLARLGLDLYCTANISLKGCVNSRKQQEGPARHRRFYLRTNCRGRARREEKDEKNVLVQLFPLYLPGAHLTLAPLFRETLRETYHLLTNIHRQSPIITRCGLTHQKQLHLSPQMQNSGRE